jgi:hypothetical protein
LAIFRYLYLLNEERFSFPHKSISPVKPDPDDNTAHKGAWEGFTDILNGVPFLMLGVDHKGMIALCTERGIPFTRSRPYKKNDHCHGEQKNNAGGE